MGKVSQKKYAEMLEQSSIQAQPAEDSQSSVAAIAPGTQLPPSEFHNTVDSENEDSGSFADDPDEPENADAKTSNAHLPAVKSDKPKRAASKSARNGEKKRDGEHLFMRTLTKLHAVYSSLAKQKEAARLGGRSLYVLNDMFNDVANFCSSLESKYEALRGQGNGQVARFFPVLKRQAHKPQIVFPVTAMDIE